MFGRGARLGATVVLLPLALPAQAQDIAAPPGSAPARVQS